MATASAPEERSRIFISYRRDDSAQAAGRLADSLRTRFSNDQVFQDIHSIAPGARFGVALELGLRNCAAVIVVIGRQWLSLTDKEGRRRIDIDKDWVRREVAESLKDKAVRVFPVLVDGARMPEAKALPADIQDLV